MMISQPLIQPGWVDASGPDSDVVISTRARLARSIEGAAFPWAASDEELEYVASRTRAAASDLQAAFPGIRTLSVDSLSDEQRYSLLDAHMASLEHTSGGVGRAIIVVSDGRLSIMVNEEDHLRIQSVMSGLAVEEAWRLVDSADDTLSGALKYAYDDNLGYLTASPSNLGTGLRISVMMHLGAQAMLHTLRDTLRAAYDLGGSVRGVMGEGSTFIGDLYQVSNEATLGISEQEIVDRVRAVANYILQKEREARKEILHSQRQLLATSASKALATLQGNMTVTSARAVSLLSTIRTAHSVGLLHGCALATLNQLLAGMRVGAAEDYNSGVARAELTRRLLAPAYILG